MRASTDERPRLQPQLQAGFECDTLDDINIADVPSLKALYTAVLGAAVEQKGVCGVLLTGMRTVGERDDEVGDVWGEDMVRFSPKSETWRVRSSPKGRIGKPLVPGELRKVAVMVRGSKSKTAKVTLVRLWLAEHALDAPATGAGRRREEATFGALGVNFFGMHIFEHHGRAKLSAHPDQPGRDNYYVVNGSFVSVTEPDAEQGGKPRVVSVQPCPIAHIKIAFSLDGADNPLPPLGPTPTARSSERGLFETRRSLMRSGFVERVVFAEQQRLVNAGESDAAAVHLSLSATTPLRQRARTLLAASEALCEQLSCTGILDAACDPVFAPVLPDALCKPNSALLILAIAVRIACYPARYNLPDSTPEDAFVAREVSLFLEAAEGAVFPRGVTDNDDEPIYAIDIVVAHTLQRFFDHVEQMRSEASANENTQELNRVQARARATLDTLYCSGIALCAEVVDTAPPDNAASAMGPSESCYDPVQAAMTEAARGRGLRSLAPRLAPVRGSTRGAQRTALVRTLLCVERWLRGGAVPPAPAPTSAAATATAALSDCFSPGTSPTPTPSPSPSPTLITPTTVASAEAPTCSTTHGAAKGSSSSSKKKLRKAQRQGTRPCVTATKARPASQQHEDAVMQSTMGARGRRRANFESGLVEDILGSIWGTGVVPQQLQLPSGVRLNGPALDEARVLLSETLQDGATFLAGFQGFLISQGAHNRCCECNSKVGVVECLAFGTDHSACRNCRHARCLSCTQRRLRRSDDSGGDDRDDGHCLFCGGAASAA